MKLFRNSLICAVVLCGWNSAFAVTGSRLAPKDRPGSAARMAISASNTEATGTDVLGSANISFSGKLDLLTANVFSGGVKVGNPFGPATDTGLGMNVFFTSTLPAAKSGTGKHNRYQDAQLLLPTGGVVNILVSPFTTVNVENYSEINKTIAGGLSYGRGELSDRYYFSAGPGAGTSAIGNILRSPNARAYLLSGLGPKVINRDVDGTTSSNSDRYGIAGIAYAGLGLDGSFLAPKDSNADPVSYAGNYRFEVYYSGSWTDRSTVRGLYSSATNPDNTASALGGLVAISISDKFQATIQWSKAVGKSKKFMGDIFLIGLNVSR